MGGSGNVAENLARVRADMAEAAQRAGRDPASVRLVAVSKTHPTEVVRQALAAGQTLFGENYLQEAAEKIKALGPGPSWHFIGHLQSNKARLAVELCDMVETVHSLKLARALDRHAAELGKKLAVLMQVNLGGEAQKSGCAPAEALGLAREVAALENLTLRGLMTMPPYDEDPEAARPIFAGLRELALRLAPGLPPGCMAELSMGMSHDFATAIEEGATLVRVGTAIFGSRY
jgi:pyridoxal phosphate enzyme (YggS family)